MVTVQLENGTSLTVWPDGKVQLCDASGENGVGYRMDDTDLEFHYAHSITV